MADLNWKELRAGNWVYSIGDVLIPEQVPDGRYLEQYAKIREPIPLNEEWVKRLKADDFCKQINGEWFYYIWGEPNGETFIPIDYVHQLQNIHFFLTGNEL